MKSEIQQQILELEKQMLSGFAVKADVRLSRAAEEILKNSSENQIDIMVMTESTRKEWAEIIESVTAHVVKYEECLVLLMLL